MSFANYDEKFARDIYDQLNVTGITENAIFPKEKKKENYRPRTLVDESLEYIDPTPNIYTLFVQFNTKFFWNVLLPVQVKWSPRMTSCAGICSFHPKNRECVIALSSPLLKLRPRKDLIETLLHEMIHAYLFLTNDNRDRDGHGPVFQSHMKRINREAGTNITIYHTFHEEVKLYQQHWWRCNGPCQRRGPFFGTVRRAMNRAPGPNDFWWKEHQMTCGGQFIKIREPEKLEKNRKKGPSGTIATTKPSENGSILNWVKKTDNKKPNSQPQNTNWNKNKSNSTSNYETDLTKLGNSTNNVHGWGTGGPSGSSSKPTSNSQTDMKKVGNSTNNVHGWGTGGPDGNSSSRSGNKNSLSNINTRISFSGTLGGSGTGRSVLLDKYSNPNNDTQKNNLFSQINSVGTSQLIKSSSAIKTVTCPNCSKTVDESKINDHLDICLESGLEPQVISDNSNKKRKSEDNCSTSNKKLKDENQISLKKVECPMCLKMVPPNDFNVHLDKCVSDDMIEDYDSISVHDSSSSSINLHDSPHLCLICDKKLEAGMSLNDHLEECVASVFNDSNNDDIEIKDTTDAKSMENEKEVLKKYPCPICMTLIEESLMNDHIDLCLTKSTENIIVLQD